MPRSMMVRKGVAIGAALGALAVAFVAGTGSSATAAQGQPVIAGTPNTANQVTSIANQTSTGDYGWAAFQAAATAFGGGIGVIGNGGNSGAGVCGYTGGAASCTTFPGTGVYGQGLSNGVAGLTSNAAASGVYGQSNGGGYGVAGRSTTGVGVLGEALGAADGVDGLANNSCCSAVYGLNSGTGNGVAGRSDTGTGVLAASTGGIGLKVDGKAQFSRSGTATVMGTTTTPKSSIRVNNVALTSKSLVLTTPQKNVGGVWIQAAVPNVAGSYVTIYLNKAVTVSYPIAWFIVEKP